MRRKKKDPGTFDEACRQLRWALAHRQPKRARQLAWLCWAYRGRVRRWSRVDQQGNRRIFHTVDQPWKAEVMKEKTRQGKRSQAKGSHHENDTRRDIESYLNVTVRSRRLAEAANLELGADLEVIDGYEAYSFLVQCRKRKEISVRAAWRDVTSAARTRHQYPVVRATFERTRVRDTTNEQIDVAIISAKYLSEICPPGLMPFTARCEGATIHVRRRWLETAAEAAAREQLPVLFLAYPDIELLALLYWRSYMKLWDTARRGS